MLTLLALDKNVARKKLTFPGGWVVALVGLAKTKATLSSFTEAWAGHGNACLYLC